MTQVTNIFKPFDNPTGNFIMFSPYTNALAEASIDSGYKVRPSRFICMNITPQQISNFQTGLNPDNRSWRPKQYVPRFFQNIIEGGATAWDNDDDKDQLSYQQFSINLLGWFKRVLHNGTPNWNSLVYDGDINLISSKDGFADIILDIPSGSGSKTYKLKNDIQFSPIDVNMNDGGNKYYIYGWGNNDGLDLSPVTGATTSVYSMTSAPAETESVWDENVFNITPTNSNFTFNSILILFDVENNDGDIIENDIPMGMYFTGDIDDNSKKINNPVTIYTSNPSAYGAGSGWSLRICTKFSPTPQGKVTINEIAVEPGSVDTNIAALLSANAETLKTINEFSQNMWINSQSYRDLLNIFKTGRTNVPYAKVVNGAGYWFVNGRNTGVKTDGTIVSG